MLAKLFKQASLFTAAPVWLGQWAEKITRSVMQGRWSSRRKWGQPLFRQCSLCSSCLKVGCNYFRLELYLPRLLPLLLLLFLECFFIFFSCVLCLEQLKHHSNINGKMTYFLFKDVLLGYFLHRGYPLGKRCQKSAKSEKNSSPF